MSKATIHIQNKKIWKSLPNAFLNHIFHHLHGFAITLIKMYLYVKY
jgi:hypothetical protein